MALETNRTKASVKRQVLCFRSNAAILDYVNGVDVPRYSQAGRGHARSHDPHQELAASRATAAGRKADGLGGTVRVAVADFVASYHAYFARNNARVERTRRSSIRMPRVILVPGIGLFGLGASAKDAGIAADIAENTVEVIGCAESISRYQPIPEEDQFDVEYWSLEQAKLGKAAEKVLGAPGRRGHRRRFGHRRCAALAMARRGRGSRRAGS